MEFIADYGLFLAKTTTVLVALVALIGFVAATLMRHRNLSPEHIEVKPLNDRYREMSDALRGAMLPKIVLKKARKADKKKQKSEDKKAKKQTPETRKRIFVLDFHGDIRGSEVALLREEITAVLLVAGEQDEVLLRLESVGGMVHAYGLAASQLARLREKNIPLTVAVDKVAASGGYLMACVGERILAAPFAIIGSIGVITQIPNFSRLLKKHDIDYEQVTAGEFKRTITMFGETTDKARQKLKEEVEETHTLFKDYVKEQRPIIDLERVATGEYWLGTRALTLNLVDELRTSDDYLMQMHESADLFEVRYTVKQKLADKIFGVFSGFRQSGLVSGMPHDEPTRLT